MRFERSPYPGGFILADAALTPEPDWFDVDYWKRHNGGEPVGEGRGTAVTAGPGSGWVLRHYRRGGFPGRLITDSYLWLGEAKSRPVCELRLLEALAERGAPVPRPLAARVERLGLFYRGDLIIERIMEARALADQAVTLSEGDWQLVGRALRRFHEAGGYHADLNARNVLLAPAGVYVVDLDRGRLMAPGGRIQRHNLARLERSLRKLNLLPAASLGWNALLAAYEKSGV